MNPHNYSSSSNIDVIKHEFMDEYIQDVKRVQLVDKYDLKKTVLLKRRLHWQGQNILEKFGDRKKIQTSKSHLIDSIDIKCPICMGVFVRSTATICGHCFCERCIFEGLLRKPQCPICRSNIKNQQFLFSQVLDKQIKNLIAQNEDESIKAEFEQRTTEHNEWNSQRKVTNIEIGEFLDVLDTEHIWCVGQIAQVMKLKGESQILIHYEGWHKMYDEYISTTSYRIAPRGFFTGRKGFQNYQFQDLPRYLASQQQDAMYSYVVPQQETSTEDTNVPNDQYGFFDLFSIIFQRRQTQRALIQPQLQALIQPNVEEIEPGEIQIAQPQINQPELGAISQSYHFLTTENTDIFIQQEGGSMFQLTDEELDIQPSQLDQ